MADLNEEDGQDLDISRLSHEQRNLLNKDTRVIDSSPEYTSYGSYDDEDDVTEGFFDPPVG